MPLIGEPGEKRAIVSPLFLLLLLSPVFDGGTTPLPTFLMRSGSAILFFLTVWGHDPPGRLPVPRLFVVPASLLILLSWASIAWAGNVWAAWQWALNITAVSLFFLAFMEACRTDTRADTALPWFFWLAGAAELSVQLLQKHSGAPRPPGTFFNPNHLAQLYSAGLLFLLAFLSAGGRAGRAGKTGAALLGIGLLAGLFLSASRAGLVCLIAGGTFLVMRLEGRRRYLRLAILPICSLALLSPVLWARFRGLGDPFAYSRIGIWRAAWEMAAENPLGVGLGNFRFHFPRFAFPVEGAVARYGKTAGNAHSELFQALADLGIPGAILFGLAAAGLLALAWTRTREDRSWRTLGCAAALVSVGVHAVLDAALHPFGLAIPAAALAAALAAGARGSSVRPAVAGRLRRPIAGTVAAVLLAGAATTYAGYVSHMKGLERTEQGDSAGAIRWERRATRADPLNPEYPFNLSGALFHAYRGDPGRNGLGAALAAMEAALRLSPGAPRFLVRKAQILGEVAGAARDGASSRHSLPGREEALRRRLASFGLAVRGEPFNALLLRVYARELVRAGRPADAEAWLRHAVRIEPNFVAGRIDLAALLDERDPERARAFRDEATAIAARWRTAPAPLTSYEQKLVQWEPAYFESVEDEGA